MKFDTEAVAQQPLQNALEAHLCRLLNALCLSLLRRRSDTVNGDRLDAELWFGTLLEGLRGKGRRQQRCDKRSSTAGRWDCLV